MIKNIAHDKKKPLEFLVFSNAYLKEVGLIERDEMENSGGEDSDGISAASSCMSDGK